MLIPPAQTEDAAEVPGDDQRILFGQLILRMQFGKTRYLAMGIAGDKKSYYIDTGVKIIIGVVVGAVILGGLYALFDGVILPTLETRIDGMFDFAG